MKITKEQLEHAIFVDKLKYREIADKFNIGRSTVDWYINHYEIITPLKKKVYPTRDELYHSYYELNISIARMSKKYNISISTVKKLLKKYDIKIKPIGTNQNHNWTFKEVKEYFNSIGYDLLEDDYINSNTPMNFKCDKGHIGKIRLWVLLRGGRCKACAVEKQADKRRFKLEEVKKIFEERGGKLLATEYKNARTPMDFICPKCGGQAKISLSNFQKGYGCANCKKIMFSGANNPNYNPNLSDYDRQELGRYEDGYSSFRIKVFARDRKCVICGSSKNKIVHHLEGYSNNVELRTDINNAVTLCEECHKQFHSMFGYGNNTKEQFEIFKQSKLSV